MVAPRAKDQARAGRPARGGPASPAPGRRPAPLPPRRGRGGAVLTALAALLTLLALLIGLPALLLYGTQAVAGMGEVAPDGIGQALTSPDDGRLFLWLLVVVGWLGWLCFAFSVLLEIPAQLRGRIARRIPAFGWSQRLAAGLVGSVIALLPVAGSAFAAAPDRAPAVAAPAELAAGTPRAALPAAQAAPALAPAADQHPSYTVRDSRPADSLWSIAERQLGSGERWLEIAKLNDGRVMDDSGIRFDAERPIQPGWELLMPGDAKADDAKAPAPTPVPAPSTPPAGTGGGAGAGHATVTVAVGDSLSAIAQRELGDAEAWPKLFDANEGVEAPDGERLTDPDVVVPGMVLTLPGATAPAPAPAPEPAPAPTAPPAPATPVPPATQAPAPAPSAPASQAPAPAPTPAAPSAHAEDAPSDDYTVALAASTVGVLLAAIMIGTVARRRGGQLRARRPRHRIALPASPAAAFEAELRTRQDDRGLDLLDRALRTMARNAVRGGKRLPAVVAARVTSNHTVELHLSGPAAPIAPFRAAHTPNIWWCAADSTELLSPAQARKAAAPYPALVTLGTAPDGSVVLADLETVRLLHLSGHPDDARDVLRTLAVELAHSPLADRLHLHLVDLAEELPISGPAAERIHRHTTLEAALTALGPRTAKARATLVAAESTSPREARSRGLADESWIPEIVLCAQQPGGDIPAELGRLLDARPRTCVAVITRAPERGTGPVARWTLPATGQATIPGLHLTLELQRLTGPQYDQVTELLRAADDTTQHPAPAWTLDGPGIDLEPAELPVPVPVLAAVGAAAEPFAGLGVGLGGDFGAAVADEDDGAEAAGPRLLARVIGTGASPFAGTDPASPAGPAAAAANSANGATNANGANGGPGARFLVNGLGRHASAHPAPPAVPAASPSGAPVAGAADQEETTQNLRLPSGPEARGDVVVPVQPLPPAAPLRPAPEPAPTPEQTSEPAPGAGAAPDDAAAERATTSEPAPTHDPAPAASAAAPRTPGRPEPAPAPEPGPAATAPAARTTPGRTDCDDLLAILRSPEAHASRTAPRIRLLGPVDVAGAAGTAEPGALPRLTELAAYLALRPGADHNALDHDLHPGAAHLDPHPTAAGAKSPLPAKLADLAAWLGTSSEGRSFLPTDTSDGYSYAPTVTCDWDEFRSLYRRGMRSTSATADAALAHALALVRGAPFAEAPPASYGWAEAERQDMIAAIVDTAHELAARRLQYGDHRSAEAAVFRGLAVAPDVELLHRDLFYAYASAGARDQLVRAVNRLDALSRRTGRDLDADTVALLRDLLAG
ncbi:BTAD domain-containing putative transcriptional regulator [Kitasatospora hibisci]|uniref:BTAD domain-containing putative transcriptional regulator n=1 Tax=Kitasatospora hibisci TaxID=3369522 RepID=UPI0037547563